MKLKTNCINLLDLTSNSIKTVLIKIKDKIELNEIIFKVIKLKALSYKLPSIDLIF